MRAKHLVASAVRVHPREHDDAVLPGGSHDVAEQIALAKKFSAPVERYAVGQYATMPPALTTIPCVCVRAQCARQNGMSYLVASSSAMLVCIHRIVRLNHGVVESTSVRELCGDWACVSAGAERVGDVSAMAATDFNKKVRRLSIGSGPLCGNRHRDRSLIATCIGIVHLPPSSV